MLLPVTVSVNCCVPLIAIDAVAGRMVTDGSKTFTVAVPEKAGPHIASMLLVPAPAPTASPMLLTVATPVAEELHVTELVTFSELPSL